MDDPQVVIMQVAERVQDLLGVPLDDSLMQRSEVLVLGVERVRHQFHED